MMLLTEELLPSECNLIQESSQDGKSMWLSGIFMQSRVQNRNKRVYPIEEITRAVHDGKARIIEQNGLMGELDHPQTLTINLDRVSHVITELWMNGDNAYGKAKILDTPMGNIAKELIRNKVKLGVSTRGTGQVNESGGVSSFGLVTVDIVAQPSAPQAYPASIMESLDIARNGKAIKTLAEQIKEDPTAQKYFKTEILKWLSDSAFAKK